MLERLLEWVSQTPPSRHNAHYEKLPCIFIKGLMIGINKTVDPFHILYYNKQTNIDKDVCV
ncbi:hypothetical protein FM106_28005 [Brachybacterium faecium]|nr:hypothetical protein FM106_28005 [Brachybacterium faecium]